MATQQNPVQYAKAIQYQLASIVTPVPVYAAFNRNFATQPKFITWMLRNVHQPVYTGGNQANKGIDRPVIQISIFTQVIEDGFTSVNGPSSCGNIDSSEESCDDVCNIVSRVGFSDSLKVIGTF